MEDQTDKARFAAWQLLNAVTDGHELYGDVAPAILAPLRPEDRARAGRLCLTTLRWMDRADRALGPYLRLKPTESLLNLLRLGTVEICQDGSAPHGVVNACVDLAKIGGGGGAGLVNAVLRKISRRKDAWAELPVPRLPKWLRKKVLRQYGRPVTEAMEAAHLVPTPMDLTARGDAAHVAIELGAELLPSGSIRLAESRELATLPGFAEGAFWVQDAAAALPARILAAKPGEHVLDLCAAPGGKTMQLAAAGARVTALDSSERRLVRLTENLARTGLVAEVVCADALGYSGGPFDAVLVDAPCTATGTIRRHPDLPYAKDASGLEGLTALQSAMIDKALTLLRPGGRMVFCTCSLLEEEGEGQIEAAMQRHPGLAVDHEALCIPGVDPAWIGPLGLRTRPDYWAERGGMDGFFVTLLRR